MLNSILDGFIYLALLFGVFAYLLLSLKSDIKRTVSSCDKFLEEFKDKDWNVVAVEGLFPSWFQELFLFNGDVGEENRVVVKERPAPYLLHKTNDFLAHRPGYQYGPMITGIALLLTFYLIGSAVNGIGHAVSDLGAIHPRASTPQKDASATSIYTTEAIRPAQRATESASGETIGLGVSVAQLSQKFVISCAGILLSILHRILAWRMRENAVLSIRRRFSDRSSVFDKVLLDQDYIRQTSGESLRHIAVGHQEMQQELLKTISEGVTQKMAADIKAVLQEVMMAMQSEYQTQATQTASTTAQQVVDRMGIVIDQFKIAVGGAAFSQLVEAAAKAEGLLVQINGLAKGIAEGLEAQQKTAIRFEEIEKQFKARFESLEASRNEFKLVHDSFGEFAKKYGELNSAATQQFRSVIAEVKDIYKQVGRNE